VVSASVDGGAALGARSISVGGTSGGGFVVYDAVATVQVEPAYGMARVGGAGGTRLDQLALFDAVGYAADGTRIGVMPAAWTTEPFDEVAEQLDDVHFAGMMAPNVGIYDPADAGLNPARPYSTNNAGNLKVVAVVDDAGNAVRGEGQLIVTVQRWNDPPIR
jgi:quinohemoprotein amine dehydrogenase